MTLSITYQADGIMFNDSNKKVRAMLLVSLNITTDFFRVFTINFEKLNVDLKSIDYILNSYIEDNIIMKMNSQKP